MSSAVHSSATEISPASLPPIPSVTIASFELSALNCGGAVWTPPPRLCDWVMLTVVAPLQLALTKLDGVIARATSAG